MVKRFESSHHAKGHEVARDIPAGSVSGFVILPDASVQWLDDGGVHVTRAKFVLGVEPIRQLAVEVDGKLQVPPIGWLSDGGWVSVPIPTGAAFDWRTPSFSWNGSCAPCHASNFVPGLQVDGGFASRFESISVSCRDCHGDATEHARSPSTRVPLSLANSVRFSFVDGGAIAKPHGVPNDTQVEVCAGCHSRRRALTAGGSVSPHVLDAFEPSLIEPHLYSAAGEVRDEVFEAGSFLSSRMHQAGVRCSSCHDAHSGTVAKNVCVNCHRAEVFAATQHHQHQTVQCVDCHMPSTTFLGVDVRHDHSLARPTEAVCRSCHRDALPPSSLTLRTQAVDSPFTRASAVLQLSPTELLQFRATDEWSRYAVAKSLDRLPPEQRVELGAPLLNDERRAIRVAAARQLIGVTPVPQHLVREVEFAEQVNAFRGDAWLTLSELARRQGQPERSRALLRTGLERDPTFVPLLINLADQRRAEAVALLTQPANEPGPFQTAAAYALGLALWREKQSERARAAFEVAATSGAGAHLVAWCLAERSVRGPAAGWACRTSALLREPKLEGVLSLGERWAEEENDDRRRDQVRRERAALNAP